MRLLVSKLGIVLLMLSLLGSNLQAGDCLIGDFFETEKQEYSKTIKKEFSINEEGTTQIKNKYGKIDVKTWEKNRVKVNVAIIVKSETETEAQTVFDRIKIDFASSDEWVKAETMIEPAKKSWWDWSETKSEFTINYEVLIPQSGSVDLMNKYGDTHLAAIDGKAKVDIKYGDFQAEKIGDDLLLNLGYGAGTVLEAEDVTADVSWSKFRLKNAQESVFTTRYSKITVEQSEKLKIDSRYDNYEVGDISELRCSARYGDVDIEMVDNIICNSHFTEFYIEKVGENADFDLRDGGVTVEHITRNFKEIVLVGKNADYKLTVEEGANYQLDANAEFAGIKYPENLNVTYENERGTNHQVKGYRGSKGNTSFIKANLSYGALKVRNN